MHAGLRLFCDRFIGERINYDLVQEALISSTTHARAIQIESPMPMFSAFYGRKLETADKVSVYGNKVGMTSSRTFDSSLRRLAR